MTARLLALFGALVGACASPPAPPTPSASYVGKTFRVHGRAIGLVPNQDSRAGVWAVIVDSAGRPYRVLVTLLRGPHLQFASGDVVTAWCRVAGDSIADSVRVERAP